MKVLVVDDDRVLADLLAFTLRREGFEVILAFDGAAAVQKWRTESPDVILLDVNLPKIDGFAVCRRIRAVEDTPIIMLTVRDEEEDIVQGLDLGADDYIQKPFSPRQLVARIFAVLRRAGKTMTPTVPKVGNITLDSSRRLLQLGSGTAISLTPLENRLMSQFMIHAGQILSTESIIDHVWGAEGADRDMVRQLVRRLRRKLEPDPANPIYIETVAGHGYGMVRPDP